MKIIMLAGKGNSSKYMYNGLKEEYDIDLVVLENKQSRLNLIKNRIKKLGLFNVLGQIAFIFYSKFLSIMSKEKINKLEKKYNLSKENFNETVVKEVSSVNDKETINIINSAKPDVIIVNGTRIISKEILNKVDAIFINTHLGITPKYRGVHGGYWALANNDEDKFGTTVHLIDEGIDTGNIIYQKTMSIDEEDNYCTYPVHQIKMGIELMKKTLNDIDKNQLKTKQKEMESNLWYHPNIITYIKNRIFKKVK